MAKLSILSAGAGLAGAMLFSSASAAPLVTVGVQNPALGPGIAIVGTPGSPVSGSLDYQSGVFDINTISGTVGVQPLLLEGQASDSITGSGSGTLNVFVTESGLTTPLGSSVPFISGLTSNFVSAGWTVTEQTYLNPGDGVFATTDLLASHDFLASGGPQAFSSETEGSTGSPGPYSLTEEFSIVATGSGNVNDTIDLSVGAVPEPSSWALMLVGLFGVGALLRNARLGRALSPYSS